jgi:hypothetical protein
VIMFKLTSCTRSGHVLESYAPGLSATKPIATRLAPFTQGGQARPKEVAASSM